MKPCSLSGYVTHTPNYTVCLAAQPCCCRLPSVAERKQVLNLKNLPASTFAMWNLPQAILRAGVTLEQRQGAQLLPIPHVTLVLCLRNHNARVHKKMPAPNLCQET